MPPISLPTAASHSSRLPVIRKVARVIGSTPGMTYGPLYYRQLENENIAALRKAHAASSGFLASPNPIAAIPFTRASGKGLL